MDEKYLLIVNGKPEGPYTLNELRAMRIRPTDFVKSATMDDYKEAHELVQLRTVFGFRQQAVAPQYFGAFDQRVLAAIIDWLIVGGIAVTVTYIPVLLLNNAVIKALLTASLLFVIPVAYLIYHIVMESSPKQATYGKMILKIRVCNVDGSDIDTAKAINRNLCKTLSILTLFIGYLMSFFTKKQQCLHDILAETLVMRDRLV